MTGGAGFIGSHIVERLVSMDVETFVIDNFSTGDEANLLACIGGPGVLHVIKGDAREARQLLKDESVDVVFHEAAIASVLRSITQPGFVHDINVNMTIELLNYCVDAGVKRFIFASSAAVYGIVDNSGASEEMLCKPNSPYGATKLSVENYLNAYFMSYGLETVALRYFNVYGRRQQLSDYSGVITVFVDKLMRGESPTINGDGTQVRDFVHVQDVVQANIRAMESPFASGEVFNVASGQSTSILELFQIIAELLKMPEAKVRFGSERPGDVKFGVASIDKIKGALNYHPEFSMREGLLGLINSLHSNPPQLVGARTPREAA